ncbi:MAG: BMP family ABC transporter substrate-binding protein [Ruminococcaceae bacterium]|nr:BMP family ABC transporter substrate-binding protein [Oscillospiraceae bacterium]
MNNKKFGRRIIAAVLLSLILTGCSGKKNLLTYETGNTDTASDISPVIDKDKMSVALLLPDDPANGACMSSAHSAAFIAAANSMGITNTDIIINPDPEAAVAEAADANIVFGGAFDYMNVLERTAKENKDKLYSCFGGYKFNSTNYSNYYTAFYEAQYLAGVAAGTNSKSGKIGIVAEYTTEYPECAAEINSFALGALAASSNSQIIVKSFKSRTDTSNAEAYTKALIDEGCDVISIQCDSSVPADYAAKNEVKFIGYGVDLSSDYKDLCLTSVVWNFEEYYKSALSSAMNGTWTDENYHGTLSDGAVKLGTLSQNAEAITQTRLDNVSVFIMNDKFEMFSNTRIVFDPENNVTTAEAALVDNKGNTMISADGTSCFLYSGETLTPVDAASVTSDKLAYAKMNYLVENVTVME